MQEVYLTKKSTYIAASAFCSMVGMTRFELATTRPPDVYSNRAELHPEIGCENNIIL